MKKNTINFLVLNIITCFQPFLPEDFHIVRLNNDTKSKSKDKKMFTAD